METVYNLIQLIDLAERKNLTSKQICRVLSEGFKLYADENQDRESLIQELKEYDYKYKNSIEKPLFLGCDVDVDTFLKEQDITPDKTDLRKYKTTKAAILASSQKNQFVAWSIENDMIYLMGEPKVQFTATPE